MKTRSRYNTKKSKLFRSTAIAVFFLVIALLVPAVITGVSRVLLQPVYAVHTWFRESSSALPSHLRDKQELIEEVEDLESRLAMAAATDVTQRRLYEENIWLRELLGADTGSRIAAAVIARPNQLPYDFMQIDQGSADGVVLGAPVYIGADNVIGIIAHTAETFSFVELFTTPGFEATAFISGANIVATVEGHGSGVARVRVPQGVALTIGSVVYVPSIQPGVFGRIAYIESTPTQPEQFGYITLSKPIKSIHYVAVGREALSLATPETVTAEIDAIKASLMQEALNTVIMEGDTATSTTTSMSTATTTEATVVGEQP